MTRWIIFILSLAAGLFGSNLEMSAQNRASCSYTVDKVMTAYEAGQFRVIRTRGTSHKIHPHGTHILAHDDGLYRLSDGAFFDQFTSGFFSPDGQYLAVTGEGIYRLSDLQLVVPARWERIFIANGEGIIGTGSIAFSPNGEYASITGASSYRKEAESQSTEGYGVFRLSDGQQMIESDSYVIYFSADSLYASTWDGVFRLSDGQKLYTTDHYVAPFSPDGAYASTRDGVLRLSDGVIVFNPGDSVYFTPDMAYAVAPFDGVFRVSDGQRLYPLNHAVPYAQAPLFSVNSQYVAIPDEGTTSQRAGVSVYRIADGTLLFEFDGSGNLSFSPDGSLIAVGNDGVYRLSNGEKLFNIQDEGWRRAEFSSDGAYLSGNDIYRVSDGALLIDFEDWWPLTTFSPDSRYVAVSYDGLYRLSDQHKLLDTKGWLSFTSDSDFIHLFNDPLETSKPSIYRISDGRRFENLSLIDEACGILSTGDSFLLVEPAQNAQKVP